MNKKIQEELQKRVQPFLPTMKQNSLPPVSISDIIKSNNNLKYVSDEKLISMFNIEDDSINQRLEGAMDQIDFIRGDITQEAEVELLHDYPEIATVIALFRDYQRSPKTSDSVKALYNLTRYLNLPARTFEHKTPHEISEELSKEKNLHPELSVKLESTFEVLSDAETLFVKKEYEERETIKRILAHEKKVENDLQNQQELNDKILAQREERERKKERNKTLKNHPFYIDNSPKLKP